MIAELQLKDLPHLATPFCEDTLALGQWDSLPYQALDGARFERLCFHLLLAEGQLPRFFGKPGQKQFGIDLICSDGLGATVYQCKNVQGFSVAKLKNWLSAFESSWPRESTSPIRRFVLFWPIDLRERLELESVLATWAQRTGIALEIVHRDIIDARLKELPGIVADHFGDAAAERYCDEKSWNQGLLHPLREGLKGLRPIEEYFELCSNGRFISESRQVEKFARIIESDSVALVCGQAGCGKTLSSIHLAIQAERPAYLLHDWEDASTDLLIEGIKLRAFRPIIAIIDDIEKDLERVSRIVRRSLAVCRGNIQFVLTTNIAPQDITSRALAGHGLVEQLFADGGFLQLRTSRRFIRRLVAASNPLESYVSEEQLDAIEAATGNDLVLLDQYLSFAPLGDRDVPLSREAFLDDVLKRYLGSAVIEARHLMNIAAVAQFDLGVPLSWLPDQAGLLQSVGGDLLISRGAPAAVTFTSSSLAELLCRALCKAHAEPDLEKAMAESIVQFLRRIDSERGSAENEMLSILQKDLKTVDSNRLKQLIFSDEEVVAQIVAISSSCSVSLFLSILRLFRQATCPAAYTTALLERLLVISGEPDATSLHDLMLLPSILFEIEQLKDPTARIFTSSSAGENWSELLAIKGNFESLLRFIQVAPIEVAQATLACIDLSRLSAILDPTRNSTNSVRIIHHKIRNFGRVQRRDLLDSLAKQIQPAELIALVMARGTVIELINLYAAFSSDFAAKLAAEVTPSMLTTLVSAAVEQNRTLGSVNLSLRELRLRTEREGIVAGPETAITARELVRLIEANGTYVALTRILVASSSAIAGQILSELSFEVIQRLVTRTILERSSLGTLGMNLRMLSMSDDDQEISQKEELEALTPVPELHRLVMANGDLVDLVKIAGASSPEHARSLVTSLQAQEVDQLFERTIGSGRKIGTLHLDMRLLNQLHDTSEGESEIEALLGAERMVRLQLSNGNILDLAALLGCSTAAFAQQLIDVLTPDICEALAGNAITQERSAGTLNLKWERMAVVELPDGRNCRSALEALLDPHPLLVLMQRSNAVIDFLKFVAAASESFGSLIVAATDSTAMNSLVDRMISSDRSAGTLNMPLKALADSHASDGSSLQADLEAKIGTKNFIRILSAQGSLFELFVILRDCTPETSAAIIGKIDEPLIDLLTEKTIQLNRSIGVFNMTFKELAERKFPDGREQREAVELLLGPERLLRIIVELGSLVDLLHIVRDLSPRMALSILTSLKGKKINELTNRAILEERSVGALSFSFKRLARKKLQEGQNLRDVLEDALGMRRLKRLMVNNGDIVSLFSILHDISLKGAEELLEVLDRRDIEILIEKAVQTERSAGSIHFTIPRLRAKIPRSYGRFNKAIGHSGWWELICGCADFEAIGRLFECNARRFAEEMLDSDAAPTIEQWSVIVDRSGFFQCCEVLDQAWFKMPSEASQRICQAFTTDLAGIAQTATWQELARGLDALEAVEREPSSALLSSFAQCRLAAANLEGLEDLPLVEIAGLARSIFRHQNDRFPQIQEALQGINLEPADWANSYEMLGETSMLLEIAHNLSPSLAEQILDSTTQLKAKKLKSASSQDLRSFLWRRFSLFMSCDRAANCEFEADQTEQFWSNVLAILRKRLGFRDTKAEHLENVALGGVIVLTCPGLRESVATILNDAMRSFVTAEKINDEAESSFELAFFVEQAIATADIRGQEDQPFARRTSLEGEDWQRKKDQFLSKLRSHFSS